MIDGVWGTVFRYLEVFDRIDDFGFLKNLGLAVAWRDAISLRPSVINAVPEGYSDRLQHFLLNKKSHISTLMSE